MIQYLSGDILYTKAQTLCHGVSTDDDFKTGLGLTLRQAYPQLYKEFRQHLKSENPKPGDYWLWKNPAKNVLQLFIRDEGSKSKQSHINRSLHEVKRHLKDLGITSLALTRLGAGLGRIDWAEVREALEAQLADLPMKVVVYENYVPGKRAE
jgi:O-acetyl-ADP-ribose deacetylase (regulator of RNase III)